MIHQILKLKAKKRKRKSLLMLQANFFKEKIVINTDLLELI